MAWARPTQVVNFACSCLTLAVERSISPIVWLGPARPKPLGGGRARALMVLTCARAFVIDNGGRARVARLGRRAQDARAKLQARARAPAPLCHLQRARAYLFAPLALAQFRGCARALALMAGWVALKIGPNVCRTARPAHNWARQTGERTDESVGKCLGRANLRAEKGGRNSLVHCDDDHCVDGGAHCNALQVGHRLADKKSKHIGCWGWLGFFLFVSVNCFQPLALRAARALV